MLTPNKQKTPKASEPTKKRSQFKDTDAVIPIVIAAKYTESSNGDFTGFRNLTIDRAPTIPRDSAIFPDITFVITKVMIGRTISVAVCENVLIQYWLDAIKTKRPEREKNINNKIDKTLIGRVSNIFLIFLVSHHIIFKVSCVAFDHKNKYFMNMVEKNTSYILIINLHKESS